MTAIAKVFMNGRSQAVRLPKEFRFSCSEVFVERDGEKIILRPKPAQWDDIFAARSNVPRDFLDPRQDDPPQKRDLF